MTTEDSKVLARIEKDLIDDRTRFEDRFNKLETVLSGMRVELESLKSAIPAVKTKIQDASSDAMQEAAKPLLEATNKLNATIEKAHKTSLLSKLFPKKK